MPGQELLKVLSQHHYPLCLASVALPPYWAHNSNRTSRAYYLPVICYKIEARKFPSLISPLSTRPNPGDMIAPSITHHMLASVSSIIFCAAKSGDLGSRLKSYARLACMAKVEGGGLMAGSPG